MRPERSHFSLQRATQTACAAGTDDRDGSECDHTMSCHAIMVTMSGAPPTLLVPAGLSACMQRTLCCCRQALSMAAK